MTEINNESGDITTDLPEIKKSIIKEYYEQWYDNKLYNLGEMRKFLEKHKWPQLTQKEKKKKISTDL